MALYLGNDECSKSVSMIQSWEEDPDNPENPKYPDDPKATKDKQNPECLGNP